MPLSKRSRPNSSARSGWCFGGCGSAVLAAAFPEVGIGLLGVVARLRPDRADDGLRHRPHLGLPPQPGGHGRPGGRRPVPGRATSLPYVVAQVVGAIAAGGVLYVIASGKPGFASRGGFAANGYGEHSPGGYSLIAGLVTEVVMTVVFLIVILGATDGRAPAGFAPIAIGLALTLIHLISIPVTNTSVNPARSAPGRRCSSAAGRSRSCGCSGSRRSSAAPSPASATSSSPETAASSRSRKRGRTSLPRRSRSVTCRPLVRSQLWAQISAAGTGRHLATQPDRRPRHRFPASLRPALWRPATLSPTALTAVTARPMTSRSNAICSETIARAAWPAAWMSPKPTVRNGG